MVLLVSVSITVSLHFPPTYNVIYYLALYIRFVGSHHMIVCTGLEDRKHRSEDFYEYGITFIHVDST